MQESHCRVLREWQANQKGRKVQRSGKESVGETEELLRACVLWSNLSRICVLGFWTRGTEFRRRHFESLFPTRDSAQDCPALLG